MAVDEGTFQLYSFIDPPLPAGDYRFRTDQLLSGTSDTGARSAADLPVSQLDTFVRVRSPRYQLPPDQVLSTFPPANSEGAYGTRLPQIVIKRRTLPWERDLAGQPSTTPWLALVLIAEGEAELKLNQPIADCVTPGVQLPGVADSELGGYLSIRKSMIDKVFPTRKDVPLLAHAREVDIHDTELMMGDDDGFLAVVVSNRLPVAGRDGAGGEVPVKYLACLVNLEGQFGALLPEAPPPRRFSHYELIETVNVAVAQWDHLVSGHLGGVRSNIEISGVGGFGPLDETDEAPQRPRVGPSAEEVQPHQRITAEAPRGAQAFTPTVDWALEDAIANPTNVYVEMAREFAVADIREVHQLVQIDPVHRFPVLLHWSFTSSGSATFQRLMEDLDSGLLATLPDPPRPPTPGREPLEVVETGHVGLPHRTRRGDLVRSWYRGPLVPHPTEDPPDGRLKLAHASDQLRIVIPDGREDLSLAAAFEIGRLLALSRPAIVGSLLRWRQLGYQTARRRSVWDGHGGLVGELLGDLSIFDIDHNLHLAVGRELVKRVAARPGELLGPPRALFDPGRPLDLDDITGEADLQLIATGFGVDPEVLRGGPIQVLDNIRSVAVPTLGNFEQRLDPKLVAVTLRAELDRSLVNLVSDTLAPSFIEHPVVGPTMPRRQRGNTPRRDRLDELLVDITDDDADDDAGDEPTADRRDTRRRREQGDS